MLTPLVVSMILCVILLLVYTITSHPHNPTYSKLTPFECGFDPLGQTRRPFSVRYFILVVLFLVFDVEIVLFFPFLTSSGLQATTLIYAILSSFLSVLLMGLLYEWYNSMLEWTYFKSAK